MGTIRFICLWVLFGMAGACAVASAGVFGTENVGPYNVQIFAGGIGLTRPLARQASILASNAPWSLTGWVRPTSGLSGVAIIGGFGRDSGSGCDCVVLRDGKLQLWLSAGAQLRTRVALSGATWSAIAATYDGHQDRLHLDGRLRAAARVATARARPLMQIAPVTAVGHFGGFLADWRVHEHVSDRPIPSPPWRLSISHPAWIGSGWCSSNCTWSIASVTC